MKKILISLLTTTVLFGAASSSQVPFDDDLFKRDTSVFSAHASFLYWRVEEGALDYALKMKTASPAGNVFAQGDFQRATYDGEPGFRVALSYFRAPKFWEIWGQYTRLTARGRDSASAPANANEFLTGTWPQLVAAPLTSATSSIHLNYNVADMFVDRYFNPNPHLRLRLLGGASAAWISQNWVVHYNNAAGDDARTRNYWGFTGGGLKIGSMVDWYWTSNIYITALANLGTFLGTYDNKAQQTLLSVNGNLRDASYSDVRTAFTMQAFFGPSYQKNFNSVRWEVFAGYEINSWFNLQEIYRSTTAAANAAKETWLNTSAMALQGLTVRMTLDF